MIFAEPHRRGRRTRFFDAKGESTHVMTEAVTWLASLRLRKGALDLSREEATRALNEARARGERGTEAWAQRLLGQVASQPESYDVAKAEGHLFEAQDLAMARGMRPLIAHCHFDLATLYRRSDDSSRTSHHLNVAIAMYREMGMTYWFEQADSELKRDDVRTM